MMLVNNFLIGEPKRWNIELLDNYVSEKDISLIYSLDISQTHDGDVYLLSYTKNGEYWIVTSLLNKETEEMYSEPSLVKL